jgi:alanine racemase
MNAWVEVDLDALDANVAAVRARLAPETDLIAVVKANAYGAGVAAVAPALEAGGVERFAVVWMREALELRASGVTRPIIVLGHSFPADADAAVQSDITLTCDSLELGRALSSAAIRAGATARVHLHIDTGLHRDGLTPDEAVALASALRTLPGLEVEGLSTHMANADEPDDSYSVTQQRRFDDVTRSLDWVPYRHTANTATTLRRPSAHRSAVRVGLALHGVQPENTPDAGLRPILSIKARVARVVDVRKGDGVSYGLTWIAPRDSRVALIPVGYADGWRRALGGSGEVLLSGRRCPMVGRVCMDQFLVDISDLPGVAPGDEAVLVGEHGADRITLQEVAARLATIPWEVTAALTSRLPRVAHRHGRVVDVM